MGEWDSQPDIENAFASPGCAEKITLDADAIKRKLRKEGMKGAFVPRARLLLTDKFSLFTCTPIHVNVRSG